MNKVIISIVITLGLITSVSFSETKKNLDPKLLKSVEESWVAPGTEVAQEIYFENNGTFKEITISLIDGVDSVQGTWYTKNDTLFQSTEANVRTAKKYSIDDEVFVLGKQKFVRLKR